MGDKKKLVKEGGVVRITNGVDRGGILKPPAKPAPEPKAQAQSPKKK